ncbi:hypothetical protein LguiA_031113 [Lonicera macranthoides]
MDFFKSVFSDNPEEESDNPPSSPSPNHNPSPNPKILPLNNAWAVGTTFFKTLASKSESVIETYRRDLEDFGSGLKKETSVIRQAMKELPARLDAGADVAQKSLELVGEAVDNLGNRVTRIIIHQGGNKESILVGDSDKNDTKFSASGQNSKPFNRVDAQIKAIQCDLNTYCEEPGDLDEYKDWKLGFVLDDKGNEIDELVEENEVVKEIYKEIVPSRVDYEAFWTRYFYRVYKARKAEEVRAQLVKRVISGEEEEELTWEVDEDDYEESDESDLKNLKSKIVNEGTVRGENDDKGRLNETGSSGDKLGVKCGDKVSSDGNDNGGSCRDSDFSVVSSQHSPAEEELGWDEIEDIGSSDDSKLVMADLRRRLSVAEEEDEELTWDVEDDDNTGS